MGGGHGNRGQSLYPLGAEIDAHYRCAGLTVTGFGAQCG
jgi:hypothetical protein